MVRYTWSMKRAGRLIILATLLLAGPAGAESVAMLVSATGVRVESHVDLKNRLVIALIPPLGAPLNGKLGIGFSSPDDRAIWIDELPRVVTIESEYFDGPVLEKLAFDRQLLATPAVLAITFGACLEESGICVLEEAEVTLSPASDGTVELAIAMIGP